jgi:Kef-type K+ transport system membrane component KefB
MLVWGANLNESIFTGASLVATSVGVTAQVLAASGLLNEVSSRVILAAAVIDDVLGLLVLSGVSSIAHGRLDLAQLLLTCFLAASFTFVIAKWGSAAVQRLAPRAQRSMRQSESRFVLSLVLLLALSVLAMRAGIAAIVGAFLAGLALAETAEERDRDLAQGLSELLVPFFLAGIGLQVDLHVFLHPAAGILAGVLLIAAVLSKFVGCGLGSLQLGKANAVRVGIGMIPRGEVGMIVAQIGLTSKILSATYYGIVVFMSVATTVIAPPLIRRVFPRKPRVQEELLRVM